MVCAQVLSGGGESTCAFTQASAGSDFPQHDMLDLVVDILTKNEVGT